MIRPFRAILKYDTRETCDNEPYKIRFIAVAGIEFPRFNYLSCKGSISKIILYLLPSYNGEDHRSHPRQCAECNMYQSIILNIILGNALIRMASALLSYTDSASPVSA